MANKIKAILFDLGNVLVDVDYNIAVKRIAHFCGRSPKEVSELLFSSDITRLFEEGKILPEEFFSEVRNMLNLSLSYARFVPIWNEIFFLSAKNRSVYSLANNLRNNYKVAILSNINILHYTYLKQYFPVFSIFHNVFASCEMGLVKPDLQIYSKTLDTLGVAPEEAFYTDDREDLIKYAVGFKIKSFIFTDARKLKSDLINSGVILN